MATKDVPHASPADAARLLVEVADVDTVYRDVYLTRARAALAPALSAEQYAGLRGVQQQIDAAVAKSRAATLLQDWKLVHEHTTHAEQLRRGAEAKAAVLAVGELVYDAPPVAVDPFSPGLARFVKSGGDLADVRDQAVAKLTRLAAGGGADGAFYENRRAFLAGLTVAARRAEPKATETAAPKAVAELERLAFEASQRGDVAELQRLAQEILTQKAASATPVARIPDEAPPPATMEACPVDLGAGFADDVTARAQKLGLAVAKTAPVPEAGPLFEYVAARMGQVAQPDAENERDGAMRIDALVDQAAWPANVAEHVKTLVGQYVRHVFVSSGGARYRPAFTAETVLIEDFAEDQEAPASSSPLLSALGLPGRRGLARDAIEQALLERGAHILADELNLDPLEFRLVCIPQDLYSRFGRDRGWGRQRQWTHFDGYQLTSKGALRALVGGDARYGGLQDLTSIAPSDERDTVVARFAIVRRARHVARWR
jgi:hypothetical protein